MYLLYFVIFHPLGYKCYSAKEYEISLIKSPIINQSVIVTLTNQQELHSIIQDKLCDHRSIEL